MILYKTIILCSFSLVKLALSKLTPAAATARSGRVVEVGGEKAGDVVLVRRARSQGRVVYGRRPRHIRVVGRLLRRAVRV